MNNLLAKYNIKYEDALLQAKDAIKQHCKKHPFKADGDAQTLPMPKQVVILKNKHVSIITSIALIYQF